MQTHRLDRSIAKFKQSADSTAQGIAPIVQYHTKGEFQPATPIVSTHETDNEILHPPTEEPLHETIETPKQVEEAYVPPVETNVEREQKEKEAQYAAWDASRWVLLGHLSFSKSDNPQSSTTSRLAA